MKKSSILVEEITLVLSCEEAEWLHAVMQNPLQAQHPIDESPHDAEMRKRFWDATSTGS